MGKEYVEERDAGFWVTGTRVSLDSLVYVFLRGESAEGIAESYPAVTIEQVCGAIAYYLANREEVDAYLCEGRKEFARLREESRRRNPGLYAKLLGARQSRERMA